MGMFDTINVFMKCPYCKLHQMFDAQTKDLDKMLHEYAPLRTDWNKSKLFGKKFRKGMPVFPSNPNDKSCIVWKDQAERTEAMAKVPDKFKKLKYVEVYADCSSMKCQFDADRRDILMQGTPSGSGRGFEGKIAIRKGFLIGEIYDIEKDDLEESKLRKYKVKYKKEFDKLKKMFAHEPIICRYWSKLARAK